MVPVNLIHGVTFSTDIQRRPRAAGEPAPARPSWLREAPRAFRLAAALAGLAAIGIYLYVALRRAGYPFDLEWLEGNSLAEVQRILHGQQLYPAPTAEYVPDGYPPLYFAVSAAAARVLGASYLTLRLVSVVSSLACFAVLARLVQRETGSLAAGTGAAGVFAATYFAAGTWFDVARVDSLFLALSVGALYAVRRMRAVPGAVIAGTLLAAAALTKQTGFAEVAAVTAVLLTGPRRGLGRVTALTEAVVLGVSTLALGLASRGWYLYYVFIEMSQHPLAYGNLGWFWTALLSLTGLAAAAALIGARRVPRELLAGCAALAVEGYAALVHSGGAINDVLPAYLAVALLAGLAAGGSRAPWVTAACGALVAAQTVILLAGAHPSQALPAAGARAAGTRLLAGMRAYGGDIAVPADPGLGLVAGMAPAAHPDAAYDVLRAANRTAVDSFRRSAEEAVTSRRFSAIIADGPGAPLDDPPGLRRYYQECLQPVAGAPTVLVPVAGSPARPAVVWIPRDRGSCQSALRVLGGRTAQAAR